MMSGEELLVLGREYTFPGNDMPYPTRYGKQKKIIRSKVPAGDRFVPKRVFGFFSL